MYCILYAIVYADDITWSSYTLIQKKICKHHDQFYLKKLEYFLSLEVKCQADGSLIVTQIKYIRDLLFKVNIEEANEVYSLC